MLMESVRKRDAQVALLRALLPLLEPAELIAVRSTPWASATFDGARHVLEVRLAGDASDARAARLTQELPETEFEMRDHFVAEISATQEGAVLIIEAVTIAAD